MGEGLWLDSEKLGWFDEIGEVLKHGTLSVGFIGLAEVLVALTGEHHGQSQRAQNLGLDIIAHMRTKLDELTKQQKLNFTPAGHPRRRFIRTFCPPG